MTARRELALAAALDLVVGEPPAAWHPVVWMGRLADRLEARLPTPGDRGELFAGGLAWSVGVATVGGAALLVRRAPWPVRGIALWTLFSGRMLVTEVDAVERALRSGGTAVGRERIARLVSRPTAQLSDGEVRMAAIETLAENLSDSWVAPLLWWGGGGVPPPPPSTSARRASRDGKDGVPNSFSTDSARSGRAS
jgi:adenosylcobinamide-phosphate synthase